MAGGAIADDPQRRRAQAVAGYTTTAVLSSLIGAATTAWQVGVLRAGAWAARGSATNCVDQWVGWRRAALYSQTVASQISTLARTSRTTFSPINFASPRLR